jgi:hypothetical protein
MAVRGCIGGRGDSLSLARNQVAVCLARVVDRSIRTRRTEGTMIELHPLCTLFPRLSGAEFDALKADIKANGLRQPIVLHEGMILDGGNRYRACLDAGVEPEFTAFEGGNLVSFVLSANLHRRHMTPGQQAAIVASAQDWAKAQAGGSGGDRRSSATLHLDSTAKRAAESGASIRTQKMADKVAKADPELAKKVAHGEVSLPKAVDRIEGRDKQVDEEAFGDFDPVAELSVAHKEISALQAQIGALSLDDTAAELRRQIEIRQGVEARLAQEMNRANELDKQLRKLGKLLETLRKLTGADTNASAIAAVRAMVAKAA